MTPNRQMLVHCVRLSQVLCPSTDPQLVTDNVTNLYEITYIAYIKQRNIQAKEGHFDGTIIDESFQLDLWSYQRYYSRRPITETGPPSNGYVTLTRPGRHRRGRRGSATISWGLSGIKKLIWGIKHYPSGPKLHSKYNMIWHYEWEHCIPSRIWRIYFNDGFTEM